MRGFLNRILCLSSGEITAETENEEALILNAFNLGDEVRDAEGSIEKGETFSFADNQVPRTKKESEEEARRRRAIQRRATREQIVDAIGVFGVRLKVRAKDGSLGSAELLRLRALLTIAAAAGQSGNSANHGDKSSYTELQVLPLVGSDCWPRLLARIVHGFFGGKEPPVLFLKIHEMHDEIPDDFIECWSCCFWALQASRLVTSADGSFFGKSLEQLKTHTYKLTGLHPDELLGDRVLEVMQKMVDRFGDRLGLDANALMNGHRRSVESLMRPIVESVGNLHRV